MFSHVETCPFNKTLWSLSDRKSFNRDNKEPVIPYDCNLNINPSCQTLSKALEISRKTTLVSSGGLASKPLKISWVIDLEHVQLIKI